MRLQETVWVPQPESADYNFCVSFPLHSLHLPAHLSVPALQLPAGFTLATGSWADLKPAARAVRHAVFVVEQGIAVALEWDQWDDTALHAVVFDDVRAPVATGRLLPSAFDPAAPATGHIGRMAVLASSRRARLGSVILLALMKAAPTKGFGDIVLHAQSYVVPFYARHGYRVEGEEFMEAGIPHRTMRVVLPAVARSRVPANANPDPAA